MGAILAKRLSEQAGAAETVMFRDGFLSEAASSNVWVVKNGAVFGVPNDHLVLEGVRYGVLAQLCAAQHIPFALKPLSKADVFDADELLLSSASKEILPITQLDAQAIGDARPGPIYQQLYCAYQALKTEDAKLYQDVLHKIWVAKGKSSQQKETEVEISQQPDGPYSKGVVEKMLFLYKEGFPILDDHSFENLIREKK